MPERVDNLMNGTYEHNKIKTPYAHIIVEGTCEKPYFEIEYYDPEKETTFIGYGSYDLSNVFRWLEENFEVEEPTADVAPVVHGKNLTEHNPVDEFKCSHCGAIFRDVVLCKIDEDSGDESYYEFEFRFCPRCGMKVELR